ncbi:hypothetical protein HGM15179_019762, partial [Zosterops borbonicus]
VFRDAHSESTETTEGAPLAPSALGEEATEELNDHNSPAVVTPQPGHSKPAEPQWELPEVQSDIKAVKSRKTEDMRSIQEEMNLYQQRTDQRKQVSEREVATPLMKHPLSCFLQNIKEQLQGELKEIQTRINTEMNRQEEEMKIMRQTLNLLLQDQKHLQKQVEVLKTHLAACKCFQQMTGKDPQGWHEALELSQPEMLQPEHGPKIVEEKFNGSRTFGEVCRALDPATGGEVLPEKEHEQIVSSEMPCQTQGELFPAQEQEEQLRQQVEEPQENEQNIKAEPQWELPEVQSDIKAVKSRKTEDMRSIQEEMNLYQQRTDQRKQNIKEQLQGELKEIQTRINTEMNRQEEEMKIMRQTLNLLLQDQKHLQKQVEVLKTHLAACKCFQQMTGKDPQGWHEALELSQPEMLQPEHGPKIVEEKFNGSRTFGEVCRALDPATGGEVAIKKIIIQELIRKEGTINELMAVKRNKNPNIVTYLESYLVHEQLWLVMEYMDGVTLSDVINETQMSEGEIATISREVRDPTCASQDLGRIVWETGVQNWSDSMCQALLLYCWYAMGKQEHLK